MKFQKIDKYSSVSVELARFDRELDKCVSECQTMLHVEDDTLTYSQQLSALINAWRLFMEEEKFVPVFVRFFLSDAANQLPALQKEFHDIFNSTCCSVVQQAPLDGSKVAMWAYLQNGVDCVRLDDFSFRCSHGAYSHYWTGNMMMNEGDSALQTEMIFKKYVSSLETKNISLTDNCVRTWLFVQNVDVNYKGVVKARKKVFEKHRLTPETHYIASTGIEGRGSDAASLVRMDAYAVAGLKPGQQQYLYGKTHLNPTYEYGVTFERGVKVLYGDRSHLFISGTASIDNKGDVLYEGDIVRQTERMWENISVLLQEGGASFIDVASMIIYLRDVSDREVVSKMYEKRFPDVPKVILYAPVCRPGWLIEMECMAIDPESNKSFANF